ncbi:CehA/McbA family metallohydrolase [Sporolactobacillus shoreicorticis]|uniref:CehA/McbA family metallohydrolase n=1 Tax=Sporolactobacillus shoreicorticis TaxID=1923877 RepID=A0ABW5RXG2_9BACL|nr:CehA/McbA family metallohydrolase [Sporolactobacillus shoreicorticis]MCO7124799.1 CehA/McbA family metallohydrolase [Sporolactobacillus shoreicorticis]
MKFILEQTKTNSNSLFKKFTLRLAPETCRLSIKWTPEAGKWGSYQLVDPKGEVRAHYIGGRTPQPVVLGRDRWQAPYTISGPFPEGEWVVHVVVLGTAGSEPLGCWGTIEIQCFDSEKESEVIESDEQLWFDNKKASFDLGLYPWNRMLVSEHRWYKGDLHTHTIYSDGKMTREENNVTAKCNQLDFFVATDHNIVPTSWPVSDVLVIPGTEVTTPIGHYNQLGARRDPFIGSEEQLAFTSDGLNRLQKRCRNHGILNSVNHPFLTEWKWLVGSTDLSLIDCIEIWNDPTYKANQQATERALKAWEIMLQDGRHVTGVGGSDSHLRPNETYPDSEEPSLIGDPGTYVYASCLSADEILSQIKKGCVFVSRHNCKIDFKVNGERPGTVLPIESDKPYQAMLRVVFDQPYRAEWIVDGQIFSRSKAVRVVKTLTFERADYHWVRVNIRDTSGRLVGFTNPVYFGNKQPVLLTWGDVLEKMND